MAGDRVAGGEHSGAERTGAGPIGLRASQLLALEFGSKAEFDDPRLEWRRLFSELLGTFLLVLVAAGGAIVHALAQISLAAAVVAPGLMVMAIILFMGAVSGAHLNPAVSVAFALRRDFPWNRLPGYVIVQLIGASLGCLFLDAVFGNVDHLGATLPGPGYAAWQALLLEVVLTAGLVSVVLGTASAAQNVGAIAALGVGGYIALAGLWSAPVSGASMNPARSFGPALVSGDFGSYWVYVAGPIAGAFIAVGCAWVLRGGGGDPTSYAAGSGRLGVNALREGRRLSWKLMHDAAAPLRVERSHGSVSVSPGAADPTPGAAPAPGTQDPTPGEAEACRGPSEPTPGEAEAYRGPSEPTPGEAEAYRGRSEPRGEDEPSAGSQDRAPDSPGANDRPPS